jgi:hypothetical protein
MQTQRPSLVHKHLDAKGAQVSLREGGETTIQIFLYKLSMAPFSQLLLASTFIGGGGCIYICLYLTTTCGGVGVNYRVVCASVRPSHPFVRPSVTSDKVHVRPIRVNVLLTLDRLNLDLLCPRWLPHRCHIEWSGLLRAHTAG